VREELSGWEAGWKGGARSSLDHAEQAALSLGLTKTALYLPSHSRVILNLFQDP